MDRGGNIPLIGQTDPFADDACRGRGACGRFRLVRGDDEMCLLLQLRERQAYIDGRPVCCTRSLFVKNVIA